MLTYDLTKRGNTPMYLWLYEQIKQDILQGRILAGEKLPSKRTLAHHLKISVITVENAYAQLMVEGYVRGVEKKGFFVNQLRELLPQPQKPPVFENTAGKNIENRENIIDLTANSLTPDQFPFSVWSRLMRQVLSEKKTELLTKPSFQGIYDLREAIAGHLYRFRGMSVDPEQILIGAGTEYLYGRLIQLFGREKIYAVEEPGYQKIAKVYEANGVSCEYIPLDESGLSCRKLKESRAQIVHISPGHHFPSGRVMPISRRQELLEWAMEDSERYIIEDDYDSEFRFAGRPIPTMQSIDTMQKVIYMNTFSKTIAPSMRISYLILPKQLMKRYKERLHFYSCTVPSFEQYTLADFISRGYLEQHINRMRNHYRGQRDALIQAIHQSRRAAYFEIMEEDAGLHFLLRIHTEKDSEAIKKAVRTAGLRISWLDDFFHVPDMRAAHIAVINYSGLHTGEISEVIRRMEQISL